MNSKNFSPIISSVALNESFYKTYGVQVNLEKYDRVALEDLRNKIRTKLSQLESNAMFNDLLENEDYQKGKLIIGIITQKLKEMIGESKQTLSEKSVSKAQQKAAGVALAAKRKGKIPKGKGAAAAMAKMSTKELEKFAGTPHKGLPEKKKPKKVSENKKNDTEEIGDQIKQAQARLRNRGREAAAKTRQFPPPPPKKSTSEGKKSKPDFLDLDKDGDTEEPMDLAARQKEQVDESYRAHAIKINENFARLLKEDEEGKAKDITAAADMVNDFTGWMQRVGQYQTKSMIELADSIRSNFGHSESEKFKSIVQPALETALDALTNSREQITRAVATLAGEEDPGMAMGAEPEEPSDLETPDVDQEEEMPADNFAASDAAAGGTELAGRELRESQLLLKAKKLAEANQLMRKLASQ